LSNGNRCCFSVAENDDQAINRRSFLAAGATLATTGLTGCTEQILGGNSSDQPEPTPDGSPTRTATETATRTPTETATDTATETETPTETSTETPEAPNDEGYRFQFIDETGAIGGSSQYSTDRSWDVIRNTLTEDEWLGTWPEDRNSVYWNDIEEGTIDLHGTSWEQVLPYVRDALEDAGENPRERIAALVRGTGMGMQETGNARLTEASGSFYQPFLTGVRKFGAELGDLQPDDMQVYWIPSSHNHELINIDYLDQDGEMQKLFCEPLWSDDELETRWRDGFLRPPEQSPYREEDTFPVDGFNYSKLLNHVLSPYVDGYELEDVHGHLASALFKPADSMGNDLRAGEDGFPPEMVFSEEYGRDLDENTSSEALAVDSQRKIVEASRKANLVYNQTGEEDYIGLDGSLGEEEFYRLTEEQANEVVQSFAEGRETVGPADVVG
jgi:hypothetical protein